MTSYVRPLNVLEQALSYISVGLAFELSGPLSANELRSAWRKAIRRFPYFSTKITEQANNFVFEKAPDFGLQLEEFDSVVVDWKEKLQAMVNTPVAAHSEGSAWLHLHSYAAKQQHQLFSVFNHSGTDARGLFYFFDCIFGYLAGDLDVAVSEVCLPNVQPWLQLNAKFTPKPNVPEAYMPHIEACAPETGAGEAVAAIWSQLEEGLTARLIQRCKAKGCTVQGALSAASMMATAKLCQVHYPLPQNLCVRCPADIRTQVIPKVDQRDNALATGFLWWAQTLQGEQTLWSVAQEATKHVRRGMADYGGIGYWYRSIIEGQEPPLTASSIGINPIRIQYGPICVHNVHMMLGTYGMYVDPRQPNSLLITTHAHTFGDRLQVSVTFAANVVQEITAAKMSAWQIDVLHHFANNMCEDMMVSDFLSNEDL